jgi:predicted Ser/Thr protein kinase
VNDPSDTSKKTRILPDSLIGKKVGPYEIQALLGKGGMGVVYRAHDPSLDRDVAIKILPPRLSMDDDYRQRFLREARIAAKIDHPRVVPVFATGESEFGAWIAMQFVRGRTLADELHDGMRPTFANVVKIAKQAAEAIGAAHRAGLIHRDIKPANLMLDSLGNIKVLDFGLARPTQAPSHTTEGTYLGTPEYSSPEQCQTNRIDGRADLYSLGVVMYEMLGGRIPHVAETPIALFTKILNEPPIPLRDLNPRVPPSLAAIVERLLSKNPAQRYPTAEALIEDLNKLVIRDEPRRSGETVVIGPADRARVAAWTLAAALAALLVAAVIHAAPWGGRVSAQNAGQPAQNTSSTPIEPQPGPPLAADNRVVFLDFKNMTGAEDARWMETGLPELVASSLATRFGPDGGLIPLERDAVIDAMRKLFNARLTSGGSDSPAAATAQGAKLLGELEAAILVRGSFFLQGETLRVITTVFVKKGEQLEVAGLTKEDGTLPEILSVADRTAAAIGRMLQPQRESSGAADTLKAAGRHPDHAEGGEALLAAAKVRLSGYLAGDGYARRELRKSLEEKSEQLGRIDKQGKRGKEPATDPDDGNTLNEPSSADHAPVEEAKPAPGGNPEAGKPQEPAKKPAPAAPRAKLEEKETKDHRRLDDLIESLRSLAQGIRDREKDLPEQELGAEGTAK